MLSFDIPEKYLELNLHFMRKYLNYEPKKRTSNPPNPHQTVTLHDHIKSGDVFLLNRLSGLDPFIAWAMGNNYAHVGVAIRRNGELMVCES